MGVIIKLDIMTIADLRAWQQTMNLSGLAASQLLGVSYATYRDWISGTSRTTGNPVAISKIVGLACAALVAGLGEWEPAHIEPYS